MPKNNSRLPFLAQIYIHLSHYLCLSHLGKPKRKPTKMTVWGKLLCPLGLNDFNNYRMISFQGFPISTKLEGQQAYTVTPTLQLDIFLCPIYVSPCPSYKLYYNNTKNKAKSFQLNFTPHLGYIQRPLNWLASNLQRSRQEDSCLTTCIYTYSYVYRQRSCSFVRKESNFITE